MIVFVQRGRIICQNDVGIGAYILLQTPGHGPAGAVE